MVVQSQGLPQDSATDASDLNFFVQNASEVLRAKKEHAASWPNKKESLPVSSEF